MKHLYPTQGTCSRLISFELTEGRVHHVEFEGGCHGNLQGIARLTEGMAASEVADRLSGIRCGNKCTSCPDQLARALRQALGQDRQ